MCRQETRFGRKRFCNYSGHLKFKENGSPLEEDEGTDPMLDLAAVAQNALSSRPAMSKEDSARSFILSHRL
jgi:hypothetical protein